MSGIGGHVNRGDRARARGRVRSVDVNRFLGGELLALYEAEAARVVAAALALAERLDAFRPTGLQPAARLAPSETVRYERGDDGWWTAVDPGPLTLGFGLASLSDAEMNDLRQTPERG